MEEKRTELGLWKKGARGDSVGQGCAWRSLSRFSVRVEGRRASWEDLRGEEERRGPQAWLPGGMVFRFQPCHIL